MKNKIFIPLSFALALVFFAACAKKEILTPSTIEEGYSLRPSGKDYDNTILDIYNQYGSFVYYSFTDKEAFWTPTGYKYPTTNAAGAWTTGFEVKPSKADFIPNQLSLLKTLVLDYYSQDFLKKFLPKRILLCESIDSVYNGYDFSTSPVTNVKKIKTVPAWSAFDQISVGLGNESIKKMSKKDSTYVMSYLHLRILKNMVENKMIQPLPSFTEIANYNVRNTTQLNAYEKGIITVYYNNPTTESDWELYVEAMITRSEAKLNATISSTTDATLNGILSSGKDKNGLIRKRYTIVRNYYKDTYGVDLQLIGNKVNP